MIPETLQLIASRRSHRAYAPTPLTQQQLDALLKAAVESPSAVNRQPWHFTVVRNQRLLDEINRATREQMMKKLPEQRSPRFADSQYHVFYHAPTVIFFPGCRTIITRTWTAASRWKISPWRRKAWAWAA